ncbi:MAG: purine-binding chemotaxis protein CheW [Chthoniobacter sp.]|nr:purine-binding chemotaxis protein CheW [Chthoniobacter sp.]
MRSMSVSTGASELWLIFETGEDRWALDVQVVERVVRAVEVTHCPGAPPYVVGLIRVEGSVVPVVSPNREAGVLEREVFCGDYMILSRTGERRIALLAERLCGTVGYSKVLPTEDPAASLENEGMLNLEDGIALVCKVGQLLTPEEEAQLTGAVSIS